MVELYVYVTNLAFISKVTSANIQTYKNMQTYKNNAKSFD